jgi:hypothetical protein
MFGAKINNKDLLTECYVCTGKYSIAWGFRYKPSDEEAGISDKIRTHTEVGIYYMTCMVRSQFVLTLYIKHSRCQ